METRSGKCSNCGAEYQVPATFTHDVARCKVCQGVVNLSPSKPNASAQSPAPVKLEEVSPRLKKGQGGSWLSPTMNAGGC